MFVPEPSTVVIVEKTRFQRWFGGEQSPVSESIEALAERGVPEAQFSLGLKFASGVGGVPDFSRAAAWYLKAADQNHLMAQFNLGQMYAAGQGLPCDPIESLRWFRQAAEHGDAGAQFNMGQTHQRASMHGTPAESAAERITAYKWFRLAADQGYLGSEAACAMMNMKMSPEDVTEGRRLVTVFNSVKVTTA